MLKLKLFLLLLFIITLFISHAHSLMPVEAMKPASLCKQNEQVLWSCEMAKGRKLASMCGSKDLDNAHGYVQYRFGRAGQIEMEFPRERVNTQSAFKYARYTRPLVTYLRLKFVTGGFTYTIKDDSDEEEKPPARSADITVKPSGSNAKETTLRCRLPVTGSLMKLEDVVQREDY
ncbi:MAG: hypothetical protein ICV60_13485 [Pyrinomonadaceae bacterium]|nr:hypothetical protein [Pyrinomonadaceae bacterium]